MSYMRPPNAVAAMIPAAPHNANEPITAPRIEGGAVWPISALPAMIVLVAILAISHLATEAAARS